MSREPPGAVRRARAVVAECLLAVAEDRPRLAALAAGPMDWPRVASLARAAMAEETVAHALVSAGVPLDGPGREALLDAYRNASAKNAMLLHDAVTIQAALHAAGVEAVALKGTALVAAHYPAPGARHVGDLDLLVGTGELRRVRESLARLGLRQPVADGPAPHPDSNHLRPWITPSGLSCEVHFRLPAAPAGAAEGVRDRSRVVAWRGRPLRVPARDDLVGIASVHALAHHAHDPRFRARLVSNLVVLEAGGARRDEARRHHGPAVDAAFRLLEAVRAGDHRAVVPALLGTVPGEIARRTAALGVVLARAARGGWLGSVFLPDRAALARRYGVAETAPLLPLLYVYRPFGAIVRVLTGR